MSSGRSFSDPRFRRGGPRPGPAWVAAILLSGIMAAHPGSLPGNASGFAAAQPKPLPPPEDDFGEKQAPPRAPAPSPSSPGAPARPAPAAPRTPQCARCGYRGEAGWNYCPACGWDLRILTDAAEEERLQAIARATVGVTVGGKRNLYATAFAYGDSGHYLTNARVLVGADTSLLRVRTFNNLEHRASIVGYDLPTGLGVIKVEQPESPRLEVAPAGPAPPDAAWAVCYPIVLEGDVVRHLPVSLHRGRITGTGQAGTEFVTFENLLRSDHAIESGCTGGPLVDARGRVAGMILGSPEDGITFATPIEGVGEIVTPLVAAREVPARPFFGVGLVMSDERRRKRFGLDSQAARPMIGYVIPDSPAAKAGVRAGDLLLAVDGDPIDAITGAGRRFLAAKPDGPGVRLAVKRAGGDQEIVVAPVKRPGRVLLEPFDEIQESLQAGIKEVTEGPGALRGLTIVDLVRGGRGEKSLYRNGDIILSVNNKTVKTADQFNTIIRGIYEKHFGESKPGLRRFPSSYVVELEIRTAAGKRVTREYMNLFPDILAPPVY